jgi:hypothetical protein
MNPLLLHLPLIIMCTMVLTLIFLYHLPAISFRLSNGKDNVYLVDYFVANTMLSRVYIEVILNETKLNNEHFKHYIDVGQFNERCLIKLHDFYNFKYEQLRYGGTYLKEYYYTKRSIVQDLLKSKQLL